MEDKYFELLEKMYSEFSEFRIETTQRFDGIDQRFDGVDQRLDGVDQRLDGLEKEIKNVGNQVVRLENNLVPKVEALFDGYIQNSEAIEEIKVQLKNLNDKVENHDIQITVINRDKKVATG